MSHLTSVLKDAKLTGGSGMLSKSVFWQGKDGYDHCLLTRDARCKFNPNKCCMRASVRTLTPHLNLASAAEADERREMGL